jgi:hypothetical protein
VKAALDRTIGLCFHAPDLEFCWVGDDGVDPLEQAQTIAILVNAGVKSVAEARAELGLGLAAAVAKFNPYHDEAGRFTDAANAVEPGSHEHVKPDRGVRVADNRDHSTTMTDAVVEQVDPAPEEIRPEGNGQSEANFKLYWNPDTNELRSATTSPGNGFEVLNLPAKPTFLAAQTSPANAPTPSGSTDGSTDNGPPVDEQSCATNGTQVAEPGSTAVPAPGISAAPALDSTGTPTRRRSHVLRWSRGLELC